MGRHLLDADKIFEPQHLNRTGNLTFQELHCRGSVMHPSALLWLHSTCSDQNSKCLLPSNDLSPAHTLSIKCWHSFSDRKLFSRNARGDQDTSTTSPLHSSCAKPSQSKMLYSPCTLNS